MPLAEPLSNTARRSSRARTSRTQVGRRSSTGSNRSPVGMRVLHWWGRFLSSNFDRALSFSRNLQRRSAVPLIVQICIAVATLALVVTAFAVVAALSQIKQTAAQVEHTLEKVDRAIPTFIATAEDARLAIETVQRL